MMRDHCYKIEGNEIISLGNKSQFSQILETLSANDWVLAIVIYIKKKAVHSFFFWCLVSILLIDKKEKDIYIKLFSHKIFGKIFIVNNTEVQILTGYSKYISTLCDDIDLPESLLTI